MLFREGGNVKQVQAWLGHHSPAFTLETYVHLLAEDLPEPPSFASSLPTTVRHFCDTNATQTGRNVTKRARTETANWQRFPSFPRAPETLPRHWKSVPGESLVRGFESRPLRLGFP
jgi:hypothetical protein